MAGLAVAQSSITSTCQLLLRAWERSQGNENELYVFSRCSECQIEAGLLLSEGRGKSGLEHSPKECQELMSGLFIKSSSLREIEGKDPIPLELKVKLAD